MGNENRERAKESFSVEIADMPALVAAIDSGASGEIGSVMLPGTVKQIDCTVNTGKTTFNLEARLYTNSLYDVQAHITGKDIRQRGSNLVYQPGDVNFVISNAKLNENKAQFIRITNGYGWDAQGQYVKVADFPKKDPKKIEDALYAFSSLITSLVRIVDEQSMQGDKLILEPPAVAIGDNDLEDLKGAVDIEIPHVDFEEIGGQPKAREELESFVFALTNPEIYEKWGTKPPKGILLVGPPGTGKTLLAKALATHAHAEFIHVKASDVGTKWYGESEKLVQRIFDAANARKGRTIIFFDELDALAPTRDRLEDGDAQVAIRVLSTIMENLDGLSSNENVSVVAATNRPDSIDPALRRPGRLDRIVTVPLPDETGRKEIFNIHIKKALDIAKRELFDNIDFDQVSILSDGFSGADIAEIIRRTLEAKLRLEIAGKEPGLVTTEDILEQMNSYEHNHKND